MQQFGGKDSKRHFTVVMGGKEHGLYVSSTPSSAAKKAVTKLCAVSKSKKVEFSIREITQGSKKKIYGPYSGYIEKLKEPIKLEGRVIKYKPVAKLQKKEGGGIFTELSNEIRKRFTSEFNRNEKGKMTPEAKNKMFENFKVENPKEPADYHYKERNEKDKHPNTLYFGKENLIDKKSFFGKIKYYPYSILMAESGPKWRFLILKSNSESNSELSNVLSLTNSSLSPYIIFFNLEINGYFILETSNLGNSVNKIIDFIINYPRVQYIGDYAENENKIKLFNIFFKHFYIIKKCIESFINFYEKYKEIEFLKNSSPYHKYFNNEYNLQKINLNNMNNCEKKLIDLKNKVHSYSREDHENFNISINKIKSEFISKFINIFLQDEELKKIYDELDDAYKQLINQEFIKFYIKDINLINQISIFIYEEKLKNSQITNEQLNKNLLSIIKETKYGKQLMNFLKREINDTKIEQEKAKLDNYLKSIRENIFTEEIKKSMKWNKKRFNTLEDYILKFKYILSYPGSDAWNFIFKIYRYKKLINPQIDDIELIKMIINENYEKIMDIHLNQEKLNAEEEEQKLFEKLY
jgi:hypothetical protein